MEQVTSFDLRGCYSKPIVSGSRAPRNISVALSHSQCQPPVQKNRLGLFACSASDWQLTDPVADEQGHVTEHSNVSQFREIPGGPQKALDLCQIEQKPKEFPLIWLKYSSYHSTNRRTGKQRRIDAFQNSTPFFPLEEANRKEMDSVRIPGNDLLYSLSRARLQLGFKNYSIRQRQ
jgi:hypothetical protein